MKQGILKATSRNMSRSEYIDWEKKFESITDRGLVVYWPPLKIENINTIRARLNGNRFPSEKWFRDELMKYKIRGFLMNWPIGNRFFADFYFPRVRLVVEIDGREHDPEVDERRDRIFRCLGLNVMRVRHNNTKEMHEVISLLETMPLAKMRFKLQRKKVSEADEYSYFPPELKRVDPNGREFTKATVIRRNGEIIKRMAG